jgi:predicted DsbA family dithiol-disulfide isomerase
MMKSSLDKLAQTEAIEIIWKSYELRPKNSPPLPPEYEKTYRERIAAAWPQTQQTALERFGIEMKTHRWGVKSRYALEGAKFAEEKGFGDAYHDAMFKAAEVGLDRVEFLVAIESSSYAKDVDDDVLQAQMYGLQGVPATIIEQKYLIPGAQSFEALADIVRQVKQRLNEQPAEHRPE